jgi:hypothetical protein
LVARQHRELARNYPFIMLRRQESNFQGAGKQLAGVHCQVVEANEANCLKLVSDNLIP